MNIEQYTRITHKLIKKKCDYAKKIENELQKIHSNITIINSLSIAKNDDTYCDYKYTINYINKNATLNKASTSCQNLVIYLYHITHDRYPFTFLEMLSEFTQNVRTQAHKYNGNIVNDELIFRKKKDAQAMILWLESIYVLNTLSEKSK